MIIKDEGASIRSCLESVRNVVDEIIVVDTGSRDDSVTICLEFGASVFSYEWNDDFSAARNYGLDRATGDWILWLDADESIDMEDAMILREAIQSGEADFFTIRLINFYGKSPNSEESFVISHLRLFRNRIGVRYENRIHEWLQYDGQKRILHLPVRVYHTGYMPSMIKHKDKQNRNTKLLKQELQNPNCSPWVHYHLASEYFNSKQYDVALNQLNFGILKFVLRGLKPPSMAYRLKYLILLELGQIRSALSSVDKAIELYPEYVDLYFIKGLLLMVNEQYPEAIDTFRHCTTLGEDNGEHLSLSGVGSFRAWYRQGACLEKMGRFEAALAAYEHSLSISSGFHAAQEAFVDLQSRLEEGH